MWMRVLGVASLLAWSHASQTNHGIHIKGESFESCWRMPEKLCSLHHPNCISSISITEGVECRPNCEQIGIEACRKVGGCSLKLKGAAVICDAIVGYKPKRSSFMVTSSKSAYSPAVLTVDKHGSHHALHGSHHALHGAGPFIMGVSDHNATALLVAEPHMAVIGVGPPTTSSPSSSPTPRPSSKPTEAPTKAPTKGPTNSPSKAPTKNPTGLPTKVPTQSPSKSPSKSPTLSPSKSPTLSPSTTPTRSPTNSPSKAPSKAPTSYPSKSPTLSPSNSPSKSPTNSPSAAPTRAPTASPSMTPSVSPTKSPSKAPTLSPSKYPTKSPSKAPSRVPTLAPTSEPTKEPTLLPTKEPTNEPSKHPTKVPTELPTKFPTMLPSVSPTLFPTKSPTWQPSNFPTRLPTKHPTRFPTGLPTSQPTTAPTKSPTLPPTQVCSAFSQEVAVNNQDCDSESSTCTISGFQSSGKVGSLPVQWLVQLSKDSDADTQVEVCVGYDPETKYHGNIVGVFFDFLPANPSQDPGVDANSVVGQGITSSCSGTTSCGQVNVEANPQFSVGLDYSLTQADLEAGKEGQYRSAVCFKVDSKIADPSLASFTRFAVLADSVGPHCHHGVFHQFGGENSSCRLKDSTDVTPDYFTETQQGSREACQNACAAVGKRACMAFNFDRGQGRCLLWKKRPLALAFGENQECWRLPGTMVSTDLSMDHTPPPTPEWVCNFKAIEVSRQHNCIDSAGSCIFSHFSHYGAVAMEYEVEIRQHSNTFHICVDVDPASENRGNLVGIYLDVDPAPATKAVKSSNGDLISDSDVQTFPLPTCIVKKCVDSNSCADRHDDKELSKGNSLWMDGAAQQIGTTDNSEKKPAFLNDGERFKLALRVNQNFPNSEAFCFSIAGNGQTLSSFSRFALVSINAGPGCLGRNSTRVPTPEPTWNPTHLITDYPTAFPTRMPTIPTTASPSVRPTSPSTNYPTLARNQVAVATTIVVMNGDLTSFDAGTLAQEFASKVDLMTSDVRVTKVLAGSVIVTIVTTPQPTWKIAKLQSIVSSPDFTLPSFKVLAARSSVEPVEATSSPSLSVGTSATLKPTIFKPAIIPEERITSIGLSEAYLPHNLQQAPQEDDRVVVLAPGQPAVLATVLTAVADGEFVVKYDEDGAVQAIDNDLTRLVLLKPSDPSLSSTGDRVLIRVSGSRNHVRFGNEVVKTGSGRVVKLDDGVVVTASAAEVLPLTPVAYVPSLSSRNAWMSGPNLGLSGSNSALSKSNSWSPGSDFGSRANKASGMASGCEMLSCKFGAVCVFVTGSATCTCPESCPDESPETDPICASDGVTYDNACDFQIARCNSRGEITKRFYGTCEDGRPDESVHRIIRSKSTNIIWVEGFMKGCNDGKFEVHSKAKSTCLVVHETRGGDWGVCKQGIAGFQYLEGFRYKLLIEKLPLKSERNRAFSFRGATSRLTRSGKPEKDKVTSGPLSSPEHLHAADLAASMRFHHARYHNRKHKFGHSGKRKTKIRRLLATTAKDFSASVCDDSRWKLVRIIKRFSSKKNLVGQYNAGQESEESDEGTRSEVDTYDEKEDKADKIAQTALQQASLANKLSRSDSSPSGLSGLPDPKILDNIISQASDEADEEQRRVLTTKSHQDDDDISGNGSLDSVLRNEVPDSGFLDNASDPEASETGGIFTLDSQDIHRAQLPSFGGRFRQKLNSDERNENSELVETLMAEGDAQAQSLLDEPISTFESNGHSKVFTSIDMFRRKKRNPLELERLETSVNDRSPDTEDGMSGLPSLSDIEDVSKAVMSQTEVFKPLSSIHARHALRQRRQKHKSPHMYAFSSLNASPSEGRGMPGERFAEFSADPDAGGLFSSDFDKYSGEATTEDENGVFSDQDSSDVLLDSSRSLASESNSLPVFRVLHTAVEPDTAPQEMFDIPLDTHPVADASLGMQELQQPYQGERLRWKRKKRRRHDTRDRIGPQAGNSDLNFNFLTFQENGKRQKWNQRRGQRLWRLHRRLEGRDSD